MAQPGLLLDDRYRLDNRIAAGGMGEVWRGTDLLLGRVVAVKLMRQQDAEGLARFRAEARYAALLQHPNIALVYDYWEGAPPGQPYLIMELVDGPSLAQILTRGPLNPARAMNVIAQAAAGLQVAHAAGLVHRDIKPGNLLVSSAGEVKIGDFGIARADGSATLTRTGLVIGTAAYLAPERVSGAPATPAADLYALGVVAHECLTGEPPFGGEPVAVAFAHLQQPLPPLPPSVPAEVARLVADLTAKDPLARPVTAGAVAARANRLQARLTGPDSPARTGQAATSGPATGSLLPPGRPAGRGTVPRSTAVEAAPGIGSGGQAPRGGRLRLPLQAAAGLGGLVAAGLAGWLVLAPGPAAPHPAVTRPRQVLPRSAPPSRPPSEPARGLVSAGQQPQPAASVAASPAPSPTLARVPSPSPPGPAGHGTPSASPAAPTTAPPATSSPQPTPTAGPVPAG